MPPIEQADIIIIGGGVVGTAIARELARYRLDVVVVERQPDLAMGTSKANSGILHAGFDAHPGTLKGELNARGNELYRTLEKDLDLDIRWIGSMVVAKDEEDRKVLDDLLERGRQNGVPGLEILPPEEVLAREPHLAPDITGALWAPSAGVICPFRATIAFAENAVQ
ncbi:FAD-dependent oxidoreductase, partial [Anaerospora sp.]